MTLARHIDSILGRESSPDELLRPAAISGRIVPVSRFADAAGAMQSFGARLSAQWAAETDNGRLSVHAAYALNTDYLVVGSQLSELSFPTLTKHYIAAGRFERQIWSLFGIVPTGHPDLRVWIKHEDWPDDAYPLRKSFSLNSKMGKAENIYEWARATGQGVFEIPVGPVHAGIIEPGHFRFQAVGEDILNLEERLGYVHKGIEKTFESQNWQTGARLAGRVSGDSTVAHALGYALAVEAASGVEAPKRCAFIRAILLERERIANHLGDIGAICNDAAFTFMFYQTAILREKMLKTNKGAFGHRLLMDLINPGSVARDVTDETAQTIRQELKDISKNFERLVEIYSDTPSLEDRVNATGRLTHETAARLSTVGYVARASNIETDARASFIIAPYDAYKPRIETCTTGDVHARTMVRIKEVRESMRLIGLLLDNLPQGPINGTCPPPREGGIGFSAVEGFRGEIIYWIRFSREGRINRCMVRDPSSVNWLALEEAIKGNIVPDFPLCNKSFNQSYSGNDL